MPSVSTTCPYCFTQKAYFKIFSEFVISEKPKFNPMESTEFYITAAAKCAGCSGLIVVRIEATGPNAEKRKLRNYLGESLGDISMLSDDKEGVNLFFVDQHPKPEQPCCPKHCPENVERAFLDAEKALLAGVFSLAAAGYRKAVERAVNESFPDAKEKRGLWNKLQVAIKSDMLPPPMQDWINVVKNEGNFAIHDGDLDFEKAEEIEPAREFARTLLQYLFTLPEQVRHAQGKE